MGIWFQTFGKWFDNIDTNKNGKLETAELAATYSLQDWQNGFLEDIENPNQYNGEFFFGQMPDFGNEEVSEALKAEKNYFDKI